MKRKKGKEIGIKSVGQMRLHSKLGKTVASFMLPVGQRRNF